jgi:hypothetical protein
MALPQKGAWARRYQQPYSGASVWGTGVHGIHSVYGSPPSRQQGIHPRQGEISVPAESVPEELHPKMLWGYQLEDSLYSDLQTDDRPPWDVPPEDSPARYSAGQQPPWNASGGYKNRFRGVKGGAYSIWQYVNGMKQPPAISETVTEGWRNKPKGSPADAKPSDPSQYEMQTSMQQRYRNRNNRLAVVRGTDEPREDIGSRVIGQKLKIYSGEKRHYDMYPFQQDEIPRPFYYRTAGTGRVDEMLPNEQWDIDPLERTPPPDPYIGQEDTTFNYGYTPEDNFYA